MANQFMTMSTNTPAMPLDTAQVPTLPEFTLPGLDGNQFVANGVAGQQPAGPQFAPVNVVQDVVNSLLDRNNAFIGNARTRAAEQAASRGLMNSSIAAGAGERAAIDAAMPLVNEAMGLTRQRENLGFQGQQSALDRIQGVNNALLGSNIAERQAMLQNRLGQESAILDTQLRQTLQQDSAKQQDWLNDRNFSREFNGVLSMMPINSAFQMNNLIQQYALEQPEIYSPDVISGMSNFFNRNMLSILQQYFPNMVGGQ